MPTPSEYMDQVRRYDAGRPTTPTADKPGIKPVPSSSFKPQRINAAPAPAPAADNRPSPLGEALGHVGDAIKSQFTVDLRPAMQAVSNFNDKVASGGFVNTRPPMPTSAQQPKLTPQGMASVNASAAGVATRNAAAMPQAQAQQPTNAFKGNYAASDPNGQGIYKDPATGKISIRLTGDEGRQFMNDRIKTANPGNTLSMSPVATPPARQAMPVSGAAQPAAQPQYQKSVVNPNGPGGLPAEETWTPTQPAPGAAQPPVAGARQPMAYNGMFAQQNNAEDALFRKQMEVMKAEQASAGSIFGSGAGSRSYVSPMLSGEQQMERQAQIKEDALQSLEADNAAATQQRLSKMMADEASGLMSPRNLAMMPYAERRAYINERDGLMKQAAKQREGRQAMNTAAEDRKAKMDETKMKDSTERRGQDIAADTTRSASEAAAQSKALDRQATLEAARIQGGDGGKDPVALERMKGFNAAIAKMYEMGQQPTPEQLKQMKLTFGIIDDSTRAAAIRQ